MVEDTKNWKDHAYTGAAMYGRFKTIMSAIVSVIVCLLMIGLSIPYVGKKTRYSKSARATVTGVTASDSRTVQGEKNSYTMYDCVVNIEYTVDNVLYERNGFLISSRTNYITGHKFNIYYNPEDPEDITTTYSFNPNTIAVTFLIIGCIGLISTIGYTYFVVKYKSIAAVTGAAHGIRDIKNAIF